MLDGLASFVVGMTEGGSVVVVLTHGWTMGILAYDDHTHTQQQQKQKQLFTAIVKAFDEF